MTFDFPGLSRTRSELKIFWGRASNRVFTLFFFCILASTSSARELPGVKLDMVELRQVIDELRLPGTVNTLRSSRLSPSVAGLLNKVEVDVGQTVKAGDLLFALDDEKARLRLVGMEAQFKEARELLREARRRLEEGLSVGAGRNIAATEIEARRSQVATAEAAYARLKAERDLQRTILERHQIRAPFEGVITQRDRELGEWVEPGDALITLVDHTHLRVDFQVPQKFFHRLDNTAEIFLAEPDASGGDREFNITARFDIAVPVADPQARTFMLRSIPSQQASLIPGMSVQAILRMPSSKQQLTVPRDALNRYPEGRTTVWVANPDTDGRYRVSEKRVQAASGFGSFVVLLSGVQAGELVVSRGNESLETGMEVRKIDGND